MVDRADVVEPLDAGKRGGSTSRPSRGVGGGRPSGRRRRAARRGEARGLDVQAVASRGVGGRPSGRRRRAARRGGHRLYVQAVAKRGAGSTSRPWPREASVVDHRADVVEPLDVQALARRRRSTIGPTSSSRSTRGSAGARRPGAGLAKRRRWSTGPTSSSRAKSRPWPREASAVVDRAGASSSRSTRGSRPGARRPGRGLAWRRRSTIGPTSSSRSTRGPSAAGGERNGGARDGAGLIVIPNWAY